MSSLELAEKELGKLYLSHEQRGTQYINGTYDTRFQAETTYGVIYDLWLYADGSYKAYLECLAIDE